MFIDFTWSMYDLCGCMITTQNVIYFAQDVMFAFLQKTKHRAYLRKADAVIYARAIFTY